MATSNYKVLTDVDLSKNKIFNITEIRNDDSENNLAIHTTGDTTINADNLAGTISTKTSLETGTSEVTINDTATETITNSKVTTVAATTTETINSTGIKIKTPSQTVVATASSKVESPSVTLVTGTPEGTGTDKQAKITLTKTAGIDNSAIVTSAKEVTVDANVTDGSITQTAPTSTYKADESNKLTLKTDSAKIESGTETITLTKSNSTRINSKSLTVDADSVTVTDNKTISVEASDSVSVDIGPKGNPSTTIDATTTEIALASKKASLTASVTESGAKKSSSISLSPAEETSLAITTDKNLKINSVSGDISVTGATLNSNATILANKDLTVAGTATFNGGAVFSKGASVNTLNLNGVTIKWDSTLGALTFSKG